MTALLITALEAYNNGMAVIPPTEDGTKRPIGEWKQYQTERPDQIQITTWYSNGRHGIGVLTGQVSGGLEMLEWEGRAILDGLYQQFVDRCDHAGLNDVLATIEDGYSETTPGGGIHLLYRCPKVDGNLKLARRPGDTPGTIDVLIETRGEGGYTITAPSHGPVHPSGRPWELVHGGFDQVATITVEQRQALLDVARSFDQMPRRQAAPATTVTTSPSGDRPGDWINQTWTWQQILAPHGWTISHTAGEETYWRRPGKTWGHSATTNYHGSDLLVVFSSSTPFDTEINYSRFAAWTLLEHDGDWQRSAKAARALMPSTGAPSDPMAWIPSSVDGTVPAGDDTPEWAARLVDGHTWITTGSDQPEPLWGNERTNLWAANQPLVIAGPQGAGKTVIGQRLILGHIGLNDQLLGFPCRADGHALYLAADRPDQARLSMRRMIDEDAYQQLEERLTVWPGPPPQDIARNPTLLLEMALHVGATLVTLDSLKDVALGLSDDEVGAGLNNAMQRCIAAEIQVIALHHPRKLSGTDAHDKPRSLDDIYGSYWLTAGAGSVLYLHRGEADTYDLLQLKSPIGERAELVYEHDMFGGDIRALDRPDLLAILTEAGYDGITIEHTARCYYRIDQVEPKLRKAMARILNKMVDEGLASKIPSAGPGRPVRYRAE